MGGAGLDDRTLRRIVALLAERAAASFAVRWLVLTILRYAECAARTYVVEVTQLEWPGIDEPLEPGCRPSDAALLAWRPSVTTPHDGRFVERVLLSDLMSRAEKPPRGAPGVGPAPSRRW